MKYDEENVEFLDAKFKTALEDAGEYVAFEFHAYESPVFSITRNGICVKKEVIEAALKAAISHIVDEADGVGEDCNISCLDDCLLDSLPVYGKILERFNLDDELLTEAQGQCAEAFNEAADRKFHSSPSNFMAWGGR
jgi:hypothetical protein